MERDVNYNREAIPWKQIVPQRDVYTRWQLPYSIAFPIQPCGVALDSPRTPPPLIGTSAYESMVFILYEAFPPQATPYTT